MVNFYLLETHYHHLNIYIDCCYSLLETHQHHLNIYIDYCYSSLFRTSGPLDGQFRAIFGQLIDIEGGWVLEYIHLYVDLLCLWFTFIN